MSPHWGLMLPTMSGSTAMAERSIEFRSIRISLATLATPSHPQGANCLVLRSARITRTGGVVISRMEVWLFMEWNGADSGVSHVPRHPIGVSVYPRNLSHPESAPPAPGSPGTRPPGHRIPDTRIPGIQLNSPAMPACISPRGTPELQFADPVPLS